MPTYLSLCYVTKPDHQNLDAYLHSLLLAVKGGVTAIQLRDKTTPMSIQRDSARAIKYVLNQLQVPLIINDNIDLALEIDADGVHLGQSDGCPVAARERLGKDKIIGWSIESESELERANQLSCIDYVAASAVFPSNTKTNCKKIWGLEGLSYLVTNSKHPVIAIGGINQTNAKAVIAHGACGIAVVSAIACHPQPDIAAAQLIQQIEGN